METVRPMISKVILIVFFNFNCGIQGEKQVCSVVKIKGNSEEEMANIIGVTSSQLK